MNTKVITFAALAALGMAAPAIAQPVQNRAAANEIGYEAGALGYAALLKGNYPVALEQMQAAEKQVSPAARRDPARLINMGLAYAKMGDLALARSHYQAAIDADRSFDVILSDGRVMDSRVAARHALRRLDQGYASR
jgi:tetratricopeptide (TPR) repeat protein